MARQINRWHLLRRALGDDHEEERYLVIQAVVRRVPLGDAAKGRLSNWLFSRFVKKRAALREEIRVAQAKWDARGQQRLDQLLAGSEILAIGNHDSPVVSIILVTRNKAHLTLLTVESILEHVSTPYELIVVDNGSDGRTLALLDKLKGAKVLSNAVNVGFGPACMQAADLARGEYLCFLNNDALLSPGAMEAALKNFDSDSVGAVGGKILLANGALQEAGSTIWSDGSALGYGRGDDPSLPQYNFRRPVDYCSAVFLLTPTRVFRQSGGFSQEFAPAYYEDTDYCMNLWQHGLRVLYEPAATILHYESASSGDNDRATPMMAAHQRKFSAKWQEALRRHYAPEPANICAARTSAYSPGLRIVYVDDRIPRRSLGAGFPRSNDIVTALAGMGHHVVCCSSTRPLTAADTSVLPSDVELFGGAPLGQKLVTEYMPCADVVWVSRPHNLKLLLRDYPEAIADRKFALVYDAEAIFAPRARAREELLGATIGPRDPLHPAGLEEELSLARMADAVVVVSEVDRQVMQNGGVDSLHVVGHALSIVPTVSSFSQRDAFLFVGSIHGTDNPNADSIRYFCKTHWDRIHRATGAEFLVAGYGTETLRSEIKHPAVQFLGKQEDLRPLYERARVFVVPTRYAAGLPFKAHEAAAFGVPLVVSPLIAQQLLWNDNIDYCATSDLDQMADCCIRLYGDQLLWERIRTHALARVAQELSPEAFAGRLRSILEEVWPAPPSERASTGPPAGRHPLARR